MSDWFLRFTRELSLPTSYLIFKGYQGMLKEFGDSFEFLMFVSVDGITRGYRQVHDDARFMLNCKKAMDEEGLFIKVLDQIEKRFDRFQKKQQIAVRDVNARTVREAFDAYESLWKLSIIPSYFGAALEGKPENGPLQRIRKVRELTGGSASKTGAEGCMEELIFCGSSVLSKKSGLPVSIFQYATPEELLGCLEGKTPPKLILEKRKRAWVLLAKKGRFNLFAGGEAEKIARKEIGNAKPPTEGPLKGTVAFGSGIEEGVGRVVFKVAKAFEIQESEILITPMTIPEMVPAMVKAKAVITDEGGLSCHAAILARELKVPCLVGTKDATSVFKNGNKIRIDFNTGTATKID